MEQPSPTTPVASASSGEMSRSQDHPPPPIDSDVHPHSGRFAEVHFGEAPWIPVLRHPIPSPHARHNFGEDPRIPALRHPLPSPHVRHNSGYFGEAHFGEVGYLGAPQRPIPTSDFVNHSGSFARAHFHQASRSHASQSRPPVNDLVWHPHRFEAAPAPPPRTRVGPRVSVDILPTDNEETRMRKKNTASSRVARAKKEGAIRKAEDELEAMTEDRNSWQDTAVRMTQEAEDAKEKLQECRTLLADMVKDRDYWKAKREQGERLAGK